MPRKQVSSAPKGFAMASATIRCINKSDRKNHYERIKSIGGTNADGGKWKQSEEITIREIESGEWQFYSEGGGRRVKVVVAIHEGRKYLKTEADSYSPDNLLSLPECP
jgi:hypothetical protein